MSPSAGVRGGPEAVGVRPASDPERGLDAGHLRLEERHLGGAGGRLVGEHPPEDPVVEVQVAVDRVEDRGGRQREAHVQLGPVVHALVGGPGGEAPLVVGAGHRGRVATHRPEDLWTRRVGLPGGQRRALLESGCLEQRVPVPRQAGGPDPAPSAGHLGHVQVSQPLVGAGAGVGGGGGDDRARRVDEGHVPARRDPARRAPGVAPLRARTHPIVHPGDRLAAVDQAGGHRHRHRPRQAQVVGRQGAAPAVPHVSGGPDVLVVVRECLDFRWLAAKRAQIWKK